MRRILTVAESEFTARSSARRRSSSASSIVPVMMAAFIAFMNYAEDHVDVTEQDASP